MGKNSTILLRDVSAVLVAAVVIGAASAAGRAANGDLDALCSSTHYKDVCIRSLSGANIDSSSSPTDIVKAAVGATAKELTAATDNIAGKFRKTKQQKEFEYCKGLFDESLALLQSVAEKAGSFQELVENSDELQHRLSNVSSLSGSCADVLDPELGAQVTSALEGTFEMLSNCITFVDSLTKVLGN